MMDKEKIINLFDCIIGQGKSFLSYFHWKLTLRFKINCMNIAVLEQRKQIQNFTFLRRYGTIN